MENVAITFCCMLLLAGGLTVGYWLVNGGEYVWRWLHRPPEMRATSREIWRRILFGVSK